MRSQSGRLAVCGMCAVLLSLAAAHALPVVQFRGVVSDGRNLPVAQAEVSIEGGGKYTTSDRGEFTFPPSLGIDVNAEVHFHVQHWVIVKPCENRNGRTFLPPPTRVIEIEVYPPHDQDLIDIDRGAKLTRCLIEEMAANFPARPSGKQRRRSARAEPYPNLQPPRANARLMAAVWRESFLQRAEPGPGDISPLVPNEFLQEKALELGFSLDQLAKALDKWAGILHPYEAYDQGLAALYQGRFGHAAELLAGAVDEQAGSSGPLVALARADYESGNYKGAEMALSRALEIHPNDSISKRDLSIVRAVSREQGANDTRGFPFSSGGGFWLAVTVTGALLAYLLYDDMRLRRAIKKTEQAYKIAVASIQREGGAEQQAIENRSESLASPTWRDSSDELHENKPEEQAAMTTDQVQAEKLPEAPAEAVEEVAAGDIGATNSATPKGPICETPTTEELSRRRDRYVRTAKASIARWLKQAKVNQHKDLNTKV
jgi:tetratricopeptide (TPR) repeat protein